MAQIGVVRAQISTLKHVSSEPRSGEYTSYHTFSATIQISPTGLESETKRREGKRKEGKRREGKGRQGRVSVRKGKDGRGKEDKGG